MEDSGLKESRVICETSDGLEITGTIVQLSRHEAVFEIYSPGAVIQTSEVFKNFTIQLRGEQAYAGRATVTSVLQTELKVVCAAALEDGLQLSPADLQPARLQALFKEYQREWQKLSQVRPEYKLHVSDMESFLTELRLWLDQLELRIRAGARGDGAEKIRSVAEELGPSVLPSIDAQFQKFEYLAERLPADMRLLHRVYAQRRLHPLVLCAPFAHRTFTKPLGYAGDYEMVNMIARNRPEGASLFAQVVNLWFVRQPPAAAHRNRLKHLTKRIVEETARVASGGRAARIFSVACGPAVEIQDFLREQELSNRAELTLLDFNEETLQHVTGAMNQLKIKCQRRTPVQFVKRSVHQLIKDSVKVTAGAAGQQYDFVYCAGLFDYLTDTVCQRLMTLLYEWVAPGGLLLATNVEPSNPMRQVMEHVLDWTLIYRRGAHLQALRPSQVEPNDFLITTDMTGVNLFMEARKPYA